MVLPSYLSNLQDLLELELFGESVIWPDGLSAMQAKLLIENYAKEYEQLKTEEGSESSSELVDEEKQVGDPSPPPQVHSKEVHFIKPYLNQKCNLGFAGNVSLVMNILKTLRLKSKIKYVRSF